MKNSNYSLTLKVPQRPKEVFDAISNVEDWWCKNLEGSTEKAGDEFEVRFADIHFSRQKITTFITGKKIEWFVTDSYLSFLTNKEEWTGTLISFDIAATATETLIVFTHSGLTENIECYEACSNAWTDYLQNSLLKLITTGKGHPYENQNEKKPALK